RKIARNKCVIPAKAGIQGRRISWRGNVPHGQDGRATAVSCARGIGQITEKRDRPRGPSR
ncbi:MAG TPA: hypothetical protein PLG27_05745, partial [Candidatus Latescibacteria bacterium]|nr:hypothetical protein [Candidatus Latescibacterota bacterium]